MRRFFIIIVFLFLAAVPAFCQSSWQTLRELRPGKKIEVIDTSMKRLTGKFVSVSDEALTFEADGRQVTVNRDKVARVSAPGHRVRNSILLGVAGLGIGAAIGHTQDTPLHTRDGIGAVIGGIAGAAGGAAIPTHQTYYRVEKPREQSAGK